MRQKGEMTDAAILGEINKKPGITVSEIAKNLKWSNGKIDGSVNRLVSEGRAKVKHCLKRSMLVKMVYPADFARKQRNLIEIPREMVDYDLWKENAVVYSLSRSTIGIARQEAHEWNEKAFAKQKVPIEKIGGNIILEMPEKLSSFYELDNSEIGLSTIGDFVLITVESILPVRLPAKYPEESRFTVTRYRMLVESEIFEGVVSTSSQLTSLIDEKPKIIKSSSATFHPTPRKNPQERVLVTTSTSEPCNELLKIPIKVK
jgi:hypothetical protein